MIRGKDMDNKIFEKFFAEVHNLSTIQFFMMMLGLVVVISIYTTLGVVVLYLLSYPLEIFNIGQRMSDLEFYIASFFVGLISKDLFLSFSNRKKK